MHGIPLRIGRRRAAAAIALAVVALAACVHVPRRGHASVRIAEYLETHRELPTAIAEAIDRGHVIVGMDPEQVVVVLGQPLSRRDYGGTPPVETWMYPRHKFHQDHHRSGSGTLFRVVVVDGKVTLVEPF